ncbi:MAG TPA: ABC transporter ATP-binding protein [Fibrobacteraceae bacterium]|nr:ABC transporter ATP-binding protein [Fibrobacteraceae bacterium]
MLQISNLTVSYQGTPVLQGLDCTVRKNTLSAILGANGSGKTTLLRSLLGYLPLDSGRFELEGENLESCTQAQRARKIAYIPQFAAKAPRIQVFDAVLLGRKPYFSRKPSPADLRRTEETLEAFGLSALSLRTLDTLSGGQRQWVFIAKAFCQDSPFIVLDEPTANLDIRHSLEFFAKLQALALRGKTILFVSHDLSLCRRFCDEVFLLGGGKIQDKGAPADISRKSIATLFQLSEETIGSLW